MKPKLYLLALSSLLFCSCAVTPRVAPRFAAPTTKPLEQSHKRAITHVEKAKAIVKTLTIRLPADKLKIDALSHELDQAQDALQTSESQRKALDSQLQAETTKANKLADDYDALHKENDKNEAVVKQVNSYWGLGAFAYGARRLATHLFWTALIGLAVVLALVILSVAVPPVGSALRLAGAVIARAANAVTSRLNRRKQINDINRSNEPKGGT